MPPFLLSFEVLDGFWFFIKIAFIAFSYVWVRATLPRYRYNQLMSIGWKVFLPVTFGLLVFYIGLLILFDGLPVQSEFKDVVEQTLPIRDNLDVFLEFKHLTINDLISKKK